jgi:Atypical Arm repeat
LTVERDVAVAERDQVIIEKDNAVRQVTEIDDAAPQRNEAYLERDTALRQRDEITVERDTVVRQKDQVTAERDTALRQRIEGDSTVRRMEALLQDFLKEGGNLLANSSSNPPMKPSNIRYIKYISGLLSGENDSVTKMVLESLRHVLELGENEKPNNNGINKIVDLMEQVDADKLIQGMQEDASDVVYEMAYKIIHLYFPDDEEEDDDDEKDDEKNDDNKENDENNDGKKGDHNENDGKEEDEK